MYNSETNESFIFSLIIEDLEGTINAENKILLQRWRADDPANEKTYQEFLSVQVNMDKLVDRLDIDAQRSWSVLDHKLRNEPEMGDLQPEGSPLPMGKRKENQFFWMKIAATVLILSSLAYGYFFWKNLDIVINTGTAVLTNVILPDGTDLKLNSGTQISYNKRTFLEDRKLVLLNGEAFIVVAANHRSRFRVEMGDVEARDIGTRFNINKRENQSIVIVEEGEVELCEKHTDNKVSLKAGKLGLYDEKRKTLTAVDNSDPNYKAWVDKSFVFNEVLLEEVIQKLEEVYQVKIEIKGAGMKERKLTAKLKYPDLNTVLHVIAASLNCELLRTDSSFVLSSH
jgi:transmembrane sensor